MSQAARDISRDRRSVALVEGEFLFTAKDFERVKRLLYEQSGINLTDGKATLVYSRLAKRLRALGLRSFHDYCELVSSPQGADERLSMLTALTTNVTRFFREPHHFDHLREAVLPALIDKARRGERVRLWSAACSSGQEPYSMAMTLMQAMPDAPQRDILILATDIDPRVVAAARKGVYAEDLLEAVPANLRRECFERADSATREWQVRAPVRELIAFRELNLLGEWPMKGRFDAIFCRNVVIYFDEPTQERVWDRFAPLLHENGALYIGHSERVTGPAAAQFVSDGMTTYRKRAVR